MVKELGKIPDEELTRHVEAGDFWVLNKPGTKEHIMIRPDGAEDFQILTFKTEELALQFKRTHEVPAEFVPRFVPERTH